MEPHSAQSARAAAVAGAIAALLFASTLQWQVNGSADPYATDIGEIQNALPRWGTLHFTGYPLYSVTGSTVVTALRTIGVEPAAGASLVSLIWGSLAIALLVTLGIAVGAHPIAAVGAALLGATAKSMWIDASVAEVHTLTMAFTFAIMLLGVEYRRSGGRALLLILALVFAQGILHMRPVVLLLPAVAVLVWPRRAEMASAWLALAAISLLSPLVYLYMPLREWMGAAWTFGETDTWSGFWTMLLDTKAERIVQPLDGPAELADRGLVIARLLHDDLPAPLIALGLAGLLATKRALALALTLAWLPYAAITLVIWEGRVSDALLAVKLPVVLFACVGLGLMATAATRRLGQRRAPRRPEQARAFLPAGLSQAAPRLPAVGLTLLAAAVAFRNHGEVVAVSHDYSLVPMVRITDDALQHPAWTDQLGQRRRTEDSFPRDGATENRGGEATLFAPWGHTYWALAYEQEYGGRLKGVNVVDHNADLTSADVLVTRPDTFYVFPKEWWEDRLGPVALQAYSPELVQVLRRPTPGAADGGDTAMGNDADGFEAGEGASSASPADSSHFTAPFRVNDELALSRAFTRRGTDGSVEVYLEWRAEVTPTRDYSVAVHLLRTGATGPDGAQGEVVDQADSLHPVFGWSPTSTWPAGATVKDAYRLDSLASDERERGTSERIGLDAADRTSSRAMTVRVTAYYTADEGEFVNGEWLALPVID